MSLTKLVDSASEKSYIEPTKPLVFRQPIATDAFGNPKVGFIDVDDARRHRRCRLLAFYATFIIITLVLICGLVSTMFMLGLGPFASFYHREFDHHDPYTASQCRIRLSCDSANSGCDLFEKIFASAPNGLHEPGFDPSNIINVSMTAFPPYPAVQILHLFSERLTVIRTANRCYIRPMRQEMLNARQRGYLNQINAGTKMQDTLEGRITSEPWIARSDSQEEDPSVIENSLIMSWCHGVPAFRLVSQNSPSSHWSPPAPSQELQMLLRDGQQGSLPGDAHVDADDDNDDDHDVDDDDYRRILTGPRRPRSINLAHAMKVKPELLPPVNSHHEHKQQQKQPLPAGCQLVDQVLEDVVLVSADGEAGPAPAARQVPVTRDLIMQCE